MKLIVIHGEHTKDSYSRLTELVAAARKRQFEIIEIDPGERGLVDNVTSGSLFGNQQLFLVKNTKKLSKKKVALLKQFVRELPGTVIVYERGALGRNDLGFLGKPDKIEEYKLTENIFVFLDAFYPGNQKVVTRLLHRLAERESVEFIFSLLAKTVRDLYWATASPQTLPYPGWRKDKLTRQARKFGPKQIPGLLADLAEIDIATKTSRASLLDSLDLLIASKL